MVLHPNRRCSHFSITTIKISNALTIQTSEVIIMTNWQFCKILQKVFIQLFWLWLNLCSIYLSLHILNHHSTNANYHLRSFNLMLYVYFNTSSLQREVIITIWMIILSIMVKLNQNVSNILIIFVFLHLNIV